MFCYVPFYAQEILVEDKLLWVLHHHIIYLYMQSRIDPKWSRIHSRVAKT